ncbi:HAMP domain-containing sensor histidine kinase [Paenibacillus sp. D2_2]|nr:HAMP domain-containing sensor histidine kinase [Paenibacillus sp. D2_2]WMT43147.1 HAMP domain-containing sensor histidine kinase [Paenibacillus sp. D2_2]
MRNRSITFKLFIISVIFFACFYLMIILSQFFFFEKFYQHYRITKVERELDKFATKYTQDNTENKGHLLEAIKFMSHSRSQLAVVNMDGNMVMEDPYQLVLELPDHKRVLVALSLFMSMNTEKFREANIKIGDELTIWGEKDFHENDSTTILYPDKIYKQNSKSTPIGENIEGDSVSISGTVVDLVLPNIKNWNQRQGLLMIALYEYFPLSQEIQDQLNSMVKQEFQWVDPWSGTSNFIIIKPVMKENGKKELLFSITSLQEISDANEALRWLFIYVGLGGIILILILALVFSKMVAKPLIALNTMAKKMLNFEFGSLKPIRQKDEIGSLSMSMLTMSQKLDKTMGELQEANQQLQKDMEQKERMEKTQKEFFTNASHELKTPLSIVKSFAEGLKDGVNLNKQDHYISVIVEEAEKMEMLIKDMLDLARLDSGTIELRKTSFMLSELVEKVASRLMYPLQDKGLEIVVVPANEQPVLADPLWFEQVVLNLITNAIRHATVGSTILIEVHSGPDRTTLSVSNQGETLNEEQLNLIWERFYRGEASRQPADWWDRPWIVHRTADHGFAWLQLLSEKSAGWRSIYRRVSGVTLNGFIRIIMSSKYAATAG